MDTSTVNQLIQTGGFMLMTIAGMVFYWWLNHFRRVMSRETDLLLDCYFYRQVIEKYKTRVAEQGEGNLYNSFRKVVIEELRYPSSRYSEPAEIEKRLNYLAQSDEELSKLISQIKFVAQ